jgi:drug/metabolite transporter (DMT)-like permease
MNVNLYIGAMLLTVAANVGYHLSQRSISAEVNPLLSLAITYAVALLLTCAALPFFPSASAAPWPVQIRSANWASYALGAAIVGLELGFLLAYRAGWKVGIAAIYSNAAVTLLLIPAGFLLFRERLDFGKALGIALAGGGLWLLGRP